MDKRGLCDVLRKKKEAIITGIWDYCSSTDTYRYKHRICFSSTSISWYFMPFPVQRHGYYLTAHPLTFPYCIPTSREEQYRYRPESFFWTQDQLIAVIKLIRYQYSWALLINTPIASIETFSFRHTLQALKGFPSETAQVWRNARPLIDKKRIPYLSLPYHI